VRCSQLGKSNEATGAVNGTEYGLVAYVYTGNLERALRVSERLEAGMGRPRPRGKVSNAAGPFGGVKQSGLGREGGHGGIEEYLATKYVPVQM
jgi:succinate-semialdehyde dehydrogenase/glutarate-semialdehyde dehydrogenase